MITVIGDVHQKNFEYLEIAKNCEASIQLGDMGFHYGHCQILDPKSHVFFGGNHDNYDVIHTCPNYLGRFGILNIGHMKDIFYVGGAYSIDKASRIEGRDWWRDEELSYGECGDCLHQYSLVQPEIVISHDGPSVATSQMFGVVPDKTITRNLMGQMWARWKPKMWIFGHWHGSKTQVIGNTTFKCLAELETFEL